MSCSFPVDKYMIVNITAVSKFISYTHDTDLLNFAHALSDCLLTERSEVPFHDVIVRFSVCTSVYGRTNFFGFHQIWNEFSQRGGELNESYVGI